VVWPELFSNDIEKKVNNIESKKRKVTVYTQNKSTYVQWK